MAPSVEDQGDAFDPQDQTRRTGDDGPLEDWRGGGLQELRRALDETEAAGGIYRDQRNAVEGGASGGYGPSGPEGTNEELSAADLAALQKMREAPDGAAGELAGRRVTPAMEARMAQLGIPEDARYLREDETIYAAAVGIGRAVTEEGGALVAVAMMVEDDDGQVQTYSRLLTPYKALRMANELQVAALSMITENDIVPDFPIDADAGVQGGTDQVETDE